MVGGIPLNAEWERIRAKVAELASSSAEPIQGDTLANAMLLIEFGQDRYVAPGDACLGYWPTIRLIWDTLPTPIEIEISQDAYEFYRFSEGRTEIREVTNVPLGPLPIELTEILDPILLPARGSGQRTN